MFHEYRSNRPVSAGVLPWPSGRTTLIAKLHFALQAPGSFQLMAAPGPLTLDVTDDQGELLYASDFAPFKAMCDVVVAGAAVRHRGSGRLSVGALSRAIDEHESLGPRLGFCPRGDPLDPSVVSSWAHGEVELSRFQAAPPDRRLAWPTRLAPVHYERAGVRMVGELSVPALRALVLAADCSRTLAAVPLVLDTLCLAPEHGRLTLVCRALYDRAYSPEVQELLALDFDPNAPVDLAAIARWPTAALAETHKGVVPASRPSERSAKQLDQTAFVSATPVGPALPFHAQAPHPQPDISSDETRPALRSKAATLPFRRSASSVAPRPALSPDDLHALRTRAAVDEAWDSRATQLVSVDRRALAVSPPPQQQAAWWDRPADQADVDSSGAAPPEPAAPTFSETKVEPALDPSQQEEARFREIAREVWAGERPLREILAGHGMTEAEWREQRVRYGRSR